MNSSVDICKDIKFWEEVISNSPIGMSIYDAESGQCLSANNVIAQYVGANLYQVLSQNFYKIPSWKLSGLLAAAKSALRDNSRRYKEVNLTTSFGRNMWAGCHFNSFCVNDKKYLLLTLLDISQPKQTDEILISERSRAQQYFDVAGVMLICLDRNQNISQINKKGCEILEYTEDEIIGKNWFDNFLPQKNIARVKNLFEKFMSGEKRGIEYYEKSILTKSGNEKIISWHDSIIKDDSGRVVKILSSGEDITERKQAVDALKKSKESYRLLAEKYLSIFQTVPVSIIMTDKNGHMNDVNQYHVDHLGGNKVNKEHYLKYKLWDHPSVKAAGSVLVNGYKNVLKGETLNLNSVYFPVTKGGRDRILNIRGVPLYKDNDVTGSVIIHENITEHYLAEKALKSQAEIHKVLMTIAFDCINIPLDKIDHAIYSALEKMGKLISADRGYVFKYDFKNNIAVNTHEWCARGVEPQKDNLQDSPMEDAPDWVEAHLKKEPLIVQDVSTLLSGNMRDILESQKIKSLITIPLFHGIKLMGFLGFDFLKTCHAYSDKEVELVKFLGEILINLNTYTSSEKILRKNTEQTKAMLAAVPDIMFRMDRDGRILNYKADVTDLYVQTKPITGKLSQDLLPPEIAKLINQKICAALNKKQIQVFEYQLAIPGQEEYDYEARMVPSGPDEVISIVRNITERKRAEERLLALNKTLDHKVKKRTQELNILNEHLIHTEEKERSNIATDLHDTVAQSLALSVSKIKTMKESDTADDGQMLSDVQNLIEQSLHEIRQLIYQLCPPVVKDFDIVTAIGFLIEEINEKFHADIKYINNPDDPFAMDEPKKITLYRAANELILNILKHSGVKKGKIELLKNQDTVVLKVEDNGIGFDMTAINKNHFNGFGLFALSERCKNMGGNFKIKSIPGEGTKTVLSIPLN
jgi:PAS domain S-box-containing protein